MKIKICFIFLLLIFILIPTYLSESLVTSKENYLNTSLFDLQ